MVGEKLIDLVREAPGVSLVLMVDERESEDERELDDRRHSWWKKRHVGRFPVGFEWRPAWLGRQTLGGGDALTYEHSDNWRCDMAVAWRRSRGRHRAKSEVAWLLFDMVAT
jgi:hypothetical protein